MVNDADKVLLMNTDEFRWDAPGALYTVQNSKFGVKINGMAQEEPKSLPPDAFLGSKGAKIAFVVRAAPRNDGVRGVSGNLFRRGQKCGFRHGVHTGIEPRVGSGSKTPETRKICWKFDWMSQILWCSEKNFSAWQFQRGTKGLLHRSPWQTLWLRGATWNG